MLGVNRRLRIIDQNVSMCELLLSTAFKEPNVIASQRCDSVPGICSKSTWELSMKDFIIIIEIYHYYYYYYYYYIYYCYYYYYYYYYY